MARAKQKNPKLAAEIAVMDELYLETDDNLRSLRLEESKIDDNIANYECLIKEQSERRDPNRSIFHIASAVEFEVETDELRRKLFEEKEKKSQIAGQIAASEARLDSLHKIRKILYKADVTEGQVETVTPETCNSEKSEGTDNQLVSLDFKSFVSKLDSAVNGLELAERFMGFDPERSKIEISAVKQNISELSSIFTEMESGTDK